jgi:hypothetical protein
MPLRPPCILCGTVDHPTSKEDLLPEWMRRFAGDTGGGKFTGTAHGRPYSEPRPPRITVKVCTGCNQWMNRTFEETTRPLLLDMFAMRVNCLDSEQQHRLAAWAAKTMTLRAAEANAPDWFMPRQELKRLRDAGNPSPDCRILVGTFGEARKRPRTLRDLQVARVSRIREATVTAMAYHSAFIFGPLVIEYLHQRVGYRFRSLAEAIGLVRRIWPASGQPIDWPVMPQITADTALSLDIAL